MNLVATNELHPSFHDMHAWSVELSGVRGEVTGGCAGESGVWRLSERDVAALPAELRSGWFPDNNYNRIGCDGISVRFSITTDEISREKSIWCPERRLCPQYATLLHWCWNGLYEHSSDQYRRRLEQLHSYFDWGIPVRRTKTGLRVFGMLGSGQEPELVRCFDDVAHLQAPEIDMTNFENTGTLLSGLSQISKD